MLAPPTMHSGPPAGGAGNIRGISDSPHIGGHAFPGSQGGAGHVPQLANAGGPPRSAPGGFGGVRGGDHNGMLGGGMSRPSIESVIESRRANNPHEVCFSVAKSVVGAVIGKGGQHLRDLQAEFGVRVYIEKEDFAGKRLVVLSYAGNSGEGSEVDSHVSHLAIQRCQEHIENIIDEQLKQKASMGGEPSYSGENNTD